MNLILSEAAELGDHEQLDHDQTGILDEFRAEQQQAMYEFEKAAKREEDEIVQAVLAVSLLEQTVLAQPASGPLPVIVHADTFRSDPTGVRFREEHRVGVDMSLDAMDLGMGAEFDEELAEAIAMSLIDEEKEN